MKKFLVIIGLSMFMFTSCATRVATTNRPTKVVYIKTPPKNHKIVVVKGKRYYYWNNKHYQKTRRGYVVVKVR
jgi:hypothetical protein